MVSGIRLRELLATRTQSQVVSGEDSRRGGNGCPRSAQTVRCLCCRRLAPENLGTNEIAGAITGWPMASEQNRTVPTRERSLQGGENSAVAVKASQARICSARSEENGQLSVDEVTCAKATDTRPSGIQ